VGSAATNLDGTAMRYTWVNTARRDLPYSPSMYMLGRVLKGPAHVAAILFLLVGLATACSEEPDPLAGLSSGRSDEARDDVVPGSLDSQQLEDGESAAVVPDPPTEPELVEVTGRVVSTVDGRGLAGAVISVGDNLVTTNSTGSFRLPDVAVGAQIEVKRPVWRLVGDVPAVSSGSAATAAPPITLEMEPVVARTLRVSREVAANPAGFERLMGIIDRTSVNAVVFDTKDETDTVLYDTSVEYAHQIGAVDVVYDPGEMLDAVRARGLYAITRIVSFEDTTWVNADPSAKLGGHWADAGNEENWRYPIDLAVEACELGFDEIQFDYVRFPAGLTAKAVSSKVPPTSAERADVIQRFLESARSVLHPMGCGVSAAVFGITMNSETDEGIGQTPETVSAVVDAISPMLYPSHYGPGWMGFADPNDHPGPVIANALDVGGPRLEANTLMRPWIQGFYYNSAQVLAQINEAEARGAGWIIWNASGNYKEEWLPPAP